MYISSTAIRVRYAETDQMGIVYHSNYFHYFEVARTEAIRQLGFSYADMEKTGVIMPVTEVRCKYIKPAVYDDLLTVKTILKHLPTDYRITFFNEVYNEKNELLATGHINLYFLEARTLKRAKMPDALFEKLRNYFS